MSRNNNVPNNNPMSKPRIEEPVSAGGVVYRVVEGNIQTVLCGRDNPIRWSLAKGTPDYGETLGDCSKRSQRGDRA